MSDNPLHPNLARLAASYDAVLDELHHQRLTNEQALERLATLEARDDNGVRWRLSAVSGHWERHTRTKGWVEGLPPAFGLATPSARDVTDAPAGYNPDRQITYLPVNESEIYDPLSLTGATRQRGASKKSRSRPPRAYVLVAVVALIVLVVLVH